MLLRSDAAPATPAVRPGSSPRAVAAEAGTSTSLCAAIRAMLPHSCAVLSASCLVIGCNLSVLGEQLAISLDLNPCGSSIAAFTVKYPPLRVDSSYSLSTCQKVFTGIPGLEWSVSGVGVAAQVALTVGGDVRALSIDIGLDGCIGIVVGELCGR